MQTSNFTEIGAPNRLQLLHHIVCSSVEEILSERETLLKVLHATHLSENA